jgi:hypothetical protein
MGKKPHYFAIDHAYVLQIQNDVAMIRLAFEEPLQLGYRFLFDPATQNEYRESPARSSLNPESHRLGPLTPPQPQPAASYFLHPGTDRKVMQRSVHFDLTENRD